MYWSALQSLSEDSSPTTQCTLTQQQLWRSVPQRDHPVGVAVPLAVFSQAERSSQSKVSQLQHAVSGDEHIGCFHVSVKNLFNRHRPLHHAPILPDQSFNTGWPPEE